MAETESIKSSPRPPPQEATQRRPRKALAAALLLLPLLCMWMLLISQLSIVWNNSSQYSYGWAVPLLCLYLLWQSWKRQPGRQAEAQTPSFISTGRFTALMALLAIAWLPVRLVQEANPGWSLVSWTQAIVVVGITLLVLWRIISIFILQLPPDSRNPQIQLKPLVFPILFFLVAVPWPYVLENPLIQALTRANTALTVEILGALGIPAVPSGNLITLSTGTVGINEACSGIRSLQAVLMISLFLGELFQLAVLRRIVCVVAGFALAMLCNLCRMLLLCWVASQKGVDAVAGWHDPAGITILVVCFLGVWACARRLRPCEKKRSPDQPTSPKKKPCTLAGLSQSLWALRFKLGTLAVWFVIVEIAVAAWYFRMESGQPAQPDWTIAWPSKALSYSEIPVPHETATMLCYDEGKQASWVSEDSLGLHLSLFRWKPGKAAGYLAKSHNPLVCMPAAGYRTFFVSQPQVAHVAGMQIPFRLYTFEQDRGRVHVLHVRWDEQGHAQSFATDGTSGLGRLRSVWKGRGNTGQKVLSLAITGIIDPESARKRLLLELSRLLLTGGNPIPQTQ